MEFTVDFKKVVEESIAGFYISTIQGKFRYVNKKFANILGYKDFNDIKNVFIPDDIYASPEERKRFIKVLKENKIIESFVVELKRKDGQKIYVILSGRLHEDNETISGWIIDISDLIYKTKELELKNRIIEENPDCIFISNKKGEILYANQSFKSLVKDSPENVKYSRNLIPMDSHEISKIEKIIKSVEQGNVYTGEINVITKDNKIIPCGVKIYGLYDHKGNVEYYISHFKDISIQKELEQQIVQIQKLEIMGKMTSSLIHDINNIISSLNSYIELLKIFRGDEDKFNKYYEKIEKLIENSEAIVGRVLRFTRKTKITKAPIPLSEIVEDLRNMVDFLLHKKPDIDIKINIKDKWKSLKILGSKSSIIQILLNLIINSIDAIEEAKREEGKINVYFDRIHVNDKYFIRIIVEDNGIGMDQDIKERIFEPFFSTKVYKEKSGTGLGLSIVAQEVENMNGRIDVCSTKGKGTKFIIIFPEQNGKEFFQEISSLPDELRTNKKRILIIDDDSFFAESLGELLNYYGFEVKLSYNGKESLDLVKNNNFDFILLDFLLKDTNAKIIVEELKNLKPHIPIFIITGLIEPIVLELQIYKNVKMILSKPITGEEIVKKMLQYV